MSEEVVTELKVLNETLRQLCSNVTTIAEGVQAIQKGLREPGMLDKPNIVSVLDCRLGKIEEYLSMIAS